MKAKWLNIILNKRVEKNSPTKLLIGLLVFFITSSSSYANPNYSTVFIQANESYAKNEYGKAIELYESILSQGIEAPELYFNLGNAYLKNKQLGLAILNYEKAKKCLPNDEDIETNLALANLKTEDKIEPVSDFSLRSLLHKLINIASEKTWSLLGITTLTFALFLYALYLTSASVQKQKLFFYLASFVLLFSLLNLLIAQQTYSHLTNSKEAIIITPVTTIKSAPTPNGTKLFLLHEGTKATVVKENDSYIEIKLSNGNVGWVQKKDVKLI